MDLEPILKLSKDLKNAASTLREQEIRFLVDAYYILQNDRIRSNNQVRAMSEDEEPHEILIWLADNSARLEKEVQKVLAAYVDNHMMGKWLQSVKGIGPVISAGLLAHIDINIATTAGKIWSFAGIAAGEYDEPPVLRVLEPELTEREVYAAVGTSYKLLFFCRDAIYYKTPEAEDLKVLYEEDGYIYTSVINDKENARLLCKKDGEINEGKSAYIAGMLREFATLQAAIYTAEELAANPLFVLKEFEYIQNITERMSFKWEKGKKRPWNAKLKTLCWKAGESFVKVSNKEDAFYGKFYAERKQAYLEKNEEFGFSEYAEKIIRQKKFSPDTDAYKAYIQGKLPLAQIHAMAKRTAVKMFLSHLHEIWYEKYHNKPAPKPYVLEHKGHVDYIPPPNKGI